MRKTLRKRSPVKSCAVMGLFIGLSGCAMFDSEGGVFENQSHQYQSAQSLENPLNPEDVGGYYEVDPLYPVPNQVKGRLFNEAPRVTKAFIPLEQGAIALLKSEEQDKIIVSELYDRSLKSAIEGFISERKLTALTSGPEFDQITEKLKNSTEQQDQWRDLHVTKWASDLELNYPVPGFFRRLFGADILEHQFAFVIHELEHTDLLKMNNSSEEKLSSETSKFSSPQNDRLRHYSTQLQIAHRYRPKGSDEISAWSWSMGDDSQLGEELASFVDFLRREVALASIGERTEITASLEVDGNGLSYLAISDRFAYVWETLLDVIPKNKWRIADVDRSQGIVFLQVRDDKTLSKMALEKFRLQLTEGPQMMTLSVEINDNDPASAQTSQYVLAVLQQKFSETFKKSNKGRSK